MRKAIRILLAAILVATLSATANAQRQAVTNSSAGPTIYDVNREVALIGTVQIFIPAAQVPPLGAHVVLQTAKGAIDVHLGDARLLAANHFSIQSGDSLRIIGETVTSGNGTQFLARIVQKGTQVLAVRSIRGIQLTYMPPRNETRAKSQAGVM